MPDHCLLLFPSFTLKLASVHTVLSSRISHPACCHLSHQVCNFVYCEIRFEGICSSSVIVNGIFIAGFSVFSDAVSLEFLSAIKWKYAHMQIKRDDDALN